MNTLSILWSYRGFILGSIQREFRARYRNSLLGATWTVLQPLAMILVYTLIFSRVMHAKLPGVSSGFGYSIFLCSGILTWGFFSEITSRSLNVFLDNSNLIKKLNFPRLCLPLILVANASVNFFVIWGLFTLFLAVSGNFPGMSYLGLIPLTLLMTMFAIGLGMTLGVLNVFFRDVGHLFGIVLQLWFWLTPIVYPMSIVPEKVRLVLELNPITPLIAAYQGILVHAVWPDWWSLLFPAATALVLCMIGLHLFRRNAGEMVDEL